MQFLTGDCEPYFGEDVVVGGLDMGPRSMVLTSYRLLTLIIGLSLTVFTVLRLVTNDKMQIFEANFMNFSSI